MADFIQSMNDVSYFNLLPMAVRLKRSYAHTDAQFFHHVDPWSGAMWMRGDPAVSGDRD